jgi:C-terminal processing protease CtpA/Prc
MSKSDDRVLQRSFIDSSKLTSNLHQFYYPFGNHNIIDQSHLSSTPIEFEFKKAKIRKDPLISVNNVPGDITFQGEASVPTRDSSEVNTKTKSTSFFRKLSSASSVSNIATKKSTLTSKSELVSRSESADPTSRRKIDYSIPRKCSISTRPDFDGLGIHIACDKKTRLSPYIHEVENGSPGIKAGLRKNDYILEVNGEDAVFMEFTQLINKIQNHIKENNLSLTVGNEKAHKKWVKNSQNAAKKICCKEVKCKK